ncbi:MAG: anti-sigma factor antagonist [Desulfarculus sp.]|nr:MAG: anti-sigma factor antagonist [Desulfarculus sp.]
MDARCEKCGQVMVLALQGRLDTMAAPAFDAEVNRLLQASERLFLLDLSGLNYISSAGLRSLLMLAKQVDARAGKLVLCGLEEMISEVFQVAGFEAIFNICQDRAAGLASLA